MLLYHGCIQYNSDADDRLLSPRRAIARIVPFTVVGIVAFALSPLGRGETNTSEFILAAVLTIVLMVAGVLAARKQNSLALNLIVLASLLPIGLLRDAEGGGLSGYAPLVVMPVLWLSIYGTKRFAYLAIAAATATLLVPVVLVGGTAYPLAEGVRNAIFWLAILALAGLAILRLKSDIRDQLGEISDRSTALFEANSHFNQAFDFAPIGMTLSNLEGAFDRVNDAYCELIGRTREEIIGTPFMEFTHVDDLDIDRVAFEQMVSGQISSYQSEKRFVHANGMTVPVLLNVAAVYNSDGELFQFFAQMQDISERKRAEADLQRLADIVNASDDAILSCTLNGDITSWNNGATKVFGYTSDEIMGEGIPRLVPGVRSGEEVTVLKRVLAGEVVQGYETQGLTNAGETVDLSLTVSPMKDLAGKIVAISLVAGDITEKNLVRAESQRVKDEFLSLVSHEFRTPLTSIIGYLELLQEGRELGFPDLRIDEFLEVIKRNSERLMRLVKDLLFVSRIQAGSFVVEKGSVDLASLISQSAESAEPEAMSHKICLKLKIDATPTVEGDSDRLSQLLDNLISNAVKYTPEGERVDVQLAQQDDFAVVTVRNSGAYIVPDELEHIFEPFFRASNAISAELPGVGLGLLITKSIVEAHEGEIMVESSREAGTTFEARIPIEHIPKAELGEIQSAIAAA